MPIQADSLGFSMLTPARLARVLDVGESTVADWLRTEDAKGRSRLPRIEHFRVGRLIRITPAAALAFIERNSFPSDSGPDERTQIPDDQWGRIERLIADQMNALKQAAEAGDE